METVQQRADRLVSQEIHVCLSSLVSTLAQGFGGAIRPHALGELDLANLCEQAAELTCSTPNYSEAARDAISKWSRGHVSDELVSQGRGDDFNLDIENLALLRSSLADIVCNDESDAQEFCEANGIEPVEYEAFEHWAVSNWFGHQLEDAGEKVDLDFAGMTVWARTTSGQAISADHVIEQIAKSLLA